MTLQRPKEALFQRFEVNEIIERNEIKLYEYTRYINGLVTLKTIKSELIKKNGQACNMCKKKFRDYLLEMDHIVPIAAGGNQFDIRNMQLTCNFCHQSKTNYNNFIIKILKKLHIIEKIEVNKWNSTIPLDQLRKIFNKLMSLHQNACEIRKLKAPIPNEQNIDMFYPTEQV